MVRVWVTVLLGLHHVHPWYGEKELHRYRKREDWDQAPHLSDSTENHSPLGSFEKWKGIAIRNHLINWPFERSLIRLNRLNTSWLRFCSENDSSKSVGTTNTSVLVRSMIGSKHRGKRRSATSLCVISRRYSESFIARHTIYELFFHQFQLRSFLSWRFASLTIWRDGCEWSLRTAQNRFLSTGLLPCQKYHFCVGKGMTIA